MLVNKTTENFETKFNLMNMPFYLTGSRYFGTNSDTSDYDIFIDVQDWSESKFSEAMSTVFGRSWWFNFDQTTGERFKAGNYTGKGCSAVYSVTVECGQQIYFLHIQVVENAVARAALQEKFKYELSVVSVVIKKAPQYAKVEYIQCMEELMHNIERQVWNILVDPTVGE